MQNQVGAQLRWLSDEYYDLNGSQYEVLDAPPTSLEFSRIVHISRPVVIKGFKIPALTRWTNEYLTMQMGERQISVAVTPNGADAVALGPEGKLYFTEPYVQKMTIADFIHRLDAHEGHEGPSEIYYLQSQNGNMYTGQFFHHHVHEDTSEFEPLRVDVPSEILWCSAAFDKSPDAVNLWIGDNRSVTSVHSDPYENIYTVVRGTKHFTLFPPTEGWCLKERTYPHATFTRSTATSPLSLIVSSSNEPPIRWSSISDPHVPGNLPPEAHPIQITLHAGETLYLPAGWWHHVRQSGDVTIALNWWYDVEIRGMTWLWLSFLRGIGDIPAGNEDDETAASLSSRRDM